jgi:hypothetical protein
LVVDIVTQREGMVKGGPGEKGGDLQKRLAQSLRCAPRLYKKFLLEENVTGRNAKLHKMVFANDFGTDLPVVIDIGRPVDMDEGIPV